MEVTEELFSFQKREKKPKGQDIKRIKTFRLKDCCRTELWKALCEKAPKGQSPHFRKTHIEFTHKERFPNFFRKNLSGKKTK